MSDVEMDSGSDDSEMVDYDEEIQQCKSKLQEDEKSVVTANRLLELLHKNGDFEELDKARQETVKWAALNANNWLEWIKDRVKSDPAPAKETIYEMFQKALFDENEVAIWVERIFYVKKNDTFDACRKTCELALTAIGNRYDAGGHVWIIFLNYERERLAMYQDTPELQSRISQYLTLCQRAVRCATTQLDDIYQETVQFCEENEQHAVLPELKKLYDATARQKEQLDAFEELIKDGKTRRQGLKAFFEYEKKSGMPARVQMAHERMVSELYDQEDVWSAYGAWTESVLKLPRVAMEVYERAIRHCPHSYILHQQALIAMEAAKKPNEEIDKMWDAAKNTIHTAEDGRSLYRTYIYLVRRRIVNAASGGPVEPQSYEPMAKLFEEAVENLNEWFGGSWDPAADFRIMQAKFYANLRKDMEKCRAVWNDILASGFGKFAAKWIEAVRVEKDFGDLQQARRYLNKALNSVSDNINEIYSFYVQFEREHGSLAELQAVLEKVNSQVAHRASRPQKKVPEVVVAPKQHDKRSGEPGVKRGADGGFKAPLAPSGSKKPTSTAPPTISTAPKAAPGTEDARTIFISNLDFTTTDDEIRQALQGVSEVRFARKANIDTQHRGFAYVRMESDEAAKEALKKDRILVKGRPMFISVNDPEKRTKFKYGTGLEKCKVFVRNVHFKASEDELKTLFSQFGVVQGVRRVTHKDGKPKGVAFVDFETEEAARKCVTTGEKLVLHERELTVALSDPPKKDSRAPGGQREAVEGGPRKGHAAKLQLVPRAIATKPPVTTAQITATLDSMDTSDSSTPSTSDLGAHGIARPLSNEAFRAMLFKK